MTSTDVLCPLCRTSLRGQTLTVSYFIYIYYTHVFIVLYCLHMCVIEKVKGQTRDQVSQSDARAMKGKGSCQYMLHAKKEKCYLLILSSSK